MRTWVVIYKDNGEAKTTFIMAETFNDVVYEIWNYLSNYDIYGIFEVTR